MCRVTFQTKKGGDTMANKKKMKEPMLEEVEAIVNSAVYKKIKKDLLAQLNKTGAGTPIFVDMVEQYMSLYVTKELCRKNIAEYGVTIEYNNGGGQSGTTDNQALEKQIKASTQMLKILNYLKISVQQIVVGEADNDEL